MALVEKLANLLYFANFSDERGSPRSDRSGKKNGRLGVFVGRTAPLGAAVGCGFSSQWHWLLYRGPLSDPRAPEGRSGYQSGIRAG